MYCVLLSVKPKATLMWAIGPLSLIGDLALKDSVNDGGLKELGYSDPTAAKQTIC